MLLILIWGPQCSLLWPQMVEMQTTSTRTLMPTGYSTGWKAVMRTKTSTPTGMQTMMETLMMPGTTQTWMKTGCWTSTTMYPVPVTITSQDPMLRCRTLTWTESGIFRMWTMTMMEHQLLQKALLLWQIPMASSLTTYMVIRMQTMTGWIMMRTWMRTMTGWPMPVKMEARVSTRGPIQMPTVSTTIRILT